MIHQARQTGYILLPVIVVITLVAAIALLMNTESALESNTAASELDAQQAQYVAEAGMNHALWLSQQQGCGPYNNLTDEPLGNDKYTSSLTTDLGSTNAVTISVDQDSWIRSDQPTINKATDLKLHTRNETLGTERPLLRYDLSPLAAKAQILSATAWFYITNAHTAGPIDIHLTSADWTETDATWNSMNSNMDNAVLATIPSQPVIGLWLPVNLTAQVQAWVNGQPNFGITLNSTVDGVHGQYNSRESANPPYLEVIIGAPPSSLAALKADATLANGVSRSISRDDVTLVQHPAGFSLSRVTTGSGQDAMLDSFYNNRDYGVHELEVSLGSGSTLEHSVLQFELPAIAPGARIISAQLDLYHYVTTRSTGTPVVDVHRVTRGWVEGSHDGTGTANGASWDTWDGSSNWTSAGGDYEVASVASSEISPTTGDWERWDVSELVQGWIDGKYSNHGLLLKGTGDFDISFASREDADPALHPKLSITYTCACGTVCVVPQGAGRIVMIGDYVGTDPDPGDEEKEAIIESWGYDVDIFDDNFIWSIDFNNYDLVYISETASSAAIIGQLSWRSIGIVNEQGNSNFDLGFANTSSDLVSDSVDIVDNDHYITAPFALGRLPIYDAQMELITASGSKAAGMQTLAEAGGVESLMLLDAGATGVNGPVPGKRVALPLGRATNSNFNWNYLNNNGRLLVQRAIEWASGGVKLPAAGSLLLVVNDDTTLTSQENAKQSLIESWNYTVNIIDSGDSQATFDAAAAANDVVFITEDISSDDLGDKLAGAIIGVVTEEDNLSDEFGFSASIHWGSGTALDIDNSHYITQPLSAGSVTIFTKSESLADMTPSYAPDMHLLGSSSDGPALAAIEAGTTIFPSGNAPGRRVILPWGGDNFDVNHLNAEGLSIFRRSLEWAANLPAVLGPIAHWKLDETSGLTAVDSEGGHDGTLANGPLWSGGQLNGALQFDGSGDVINVAHDDSLSLNNFTISAWIHPDTVSGVHSIVYKGATTAEANYHFYTSGDEFTLGLTNGGWQYYISSTNANLISGQWSHVTASFAGSSGDVKLYLDGTLIDSGTIAVAAVLNNGPITIGSDPFNEHWQGRLDDVRIYNRVLSDAEVAELALPPGPIAHWKLDETSGPTAIDAEGGHDGTWTNGPAATPGVLDGGLDFDGSNDYVDAGTFDATGSGITMMGWFNAEAIATDDGRVVSKANGPNEGDAWWQLSTTDSGSSRYLRMRIKAGGTTTTFADSSVNLTAGQWYFAVGTYDSATGDMRLYLDGVEVANGSHAVGGSIDTDAAVPVAIGANGTAERFFNGILDDVRIYDYALSASEISDLYAANAPLGPSSYTEMFQPWSATSVDTWQTVDLGAFGVPASAVVEVAVINSDTGKEHSGGVRAVGSSLERRFLLHEAEGNGVDAVTMHVQADTSSQIQHYSAKTGNLTFILLGYWTGATYVERFDAFKAGVNASWQGHNLGAYGVAANRVAEIAMSQTSTSVEWLVGARSAGSILQRRIKLHEAENGGIDMVTLQVASDASSMIEVYAEANSVVDFHLLGYWSTPPGTYTETGGVHGQATVSASWQTTDLSSFGIPANSIAQFVMSNERDARENQMGLRETVSTINNRRLDLQEAESGGGDLGSMHVKVDASSQIQWAAEYGATEGFFYPVGWWVLSP